MKTLIVLNVVSLEVPGASRLHIKRIERPLTTMSEVPVADPSSSNIAIAIWDFSVACDARRRGPWRGHRRACDRHGK